MKRMILIGSTGSGKTTLTQVLNHVEKGYRKTQAIEFHSHIIDTPGEYIENRRFYSALITSASDCDVVGLIQDCTSKACIFPPGFAAMFNKPVIGIMTKIDCIERKEAWAESCLVHAGANKIFKISSLDGSGIEEIQSFLI